MIFSPAEFNLQRYLLPHRLALGIQFQDLSPKLRGMLFVFTENSKEN